MRRVNRKYTAMASLGHHSLFAEAQDRGLPISSPGLRWAIACDGDGGGSTIVLGRRILGDDPKLRMSFANMQ